MTKNHCYNLGLLFYDVAEKNSQHIALKYPSGKNFTYKELDNSSNQIARYLQQLGIEKGDVIGIFNNKTVAGYALMLACLKVGAVYANFDNTSPWLRVSKMLENCKPKVIFNDFNLSPFANEINQNLNFKIVNLHAEEFMVTCNNFDPTNLSETASIHGGDPAYIMFTSGSTGFPKGAVMSHNNVLNFISWGQATFSVTSSDVFTNVNPIYFDNSVFDFYTSLYSGACLVPFSSDVVADSVQLVKTVNAMACTIWFSVPSLLVYLLTTRALKTTDFSSLTRISFGGEGFPKTKLKQLFDLFGNRIKLFNVYGPTECTCICSSYVISDKDFDSLNELAPLGNIAPNFGYEILPVSDQDIKFGELGLTGPNVGLGYYNDEERSQIAFVQNPNKLYSERMYKTGDLVEKREDGYLYFRGRIGNQIKHMGYRIELEEIEAGINSLKYINESGVVYKKITADLGQIVAYVSVNRPKNESEIESDLRALLPLYMMPKKILVLEALPKNRNGKIDRNQLKEIN